MNKQILTDTGFWIGLIDPKDQFSENSQTIADLIAGQNIIFPWPCMYETLRTKYSRRRDAVLILENTLKSSNVHLLDDNSYKYTALDNTLINIKLNKSFQSLADNVIIEILKDINIKIDYLVTFNKRDFAEICHKRKIEILE